MHVIELASPSFLRSVLMKACCPQLPTIIMKRTANVRERERHEPEAPVERHSAPR